MPRTAIVRDNRYMDHYTGEYHPESHERLAAIYGMLDESGLMEKLVLIEPRSCSEEELQYIHDASYIERVKSTAGRQRVMLDPDTQTSPLSWEVSRLAVGGLLNAVDGVVEGRADNAFALIRPPGHHAERNRAMGFCLFNNVAIAAEHLKRRHEMERIAIVDWDLHHGNATQHSFYGDPGVLYFSTHQYPYYPGTGSLNEVGSGEGEGYTVNVPLRPGPGDEEYVEIFKQILAPIVLDYKPQMILVSAGFDIYYQDPLGGMNVTPGGFAMLTKVIMELAEECCGGRFAITLEGGYHLDGLRSSVRAVLLTMLGEKEDLSGRRIIKEEPTDAAGDVIKAEKEVYRKYWPRLG